MDAKNRGCVTNVFRVVNKKTEERFNKWCEAHNISEGNGISHLFHGSPMQNWWSITTNGLWIRPGLNGGMFGPGLYFAPESDKAVGYTGFGCWRSQGDAYGYLSLNKVATGTPFYYYRSNGSSADMSLMAMNKHNTNCLWAESEKKLHNSPLRRDEVIIYDDAQSTIEYLIEVKNPHSY
jgi:poly [ADP-ribose] polymerase